MTVAVTGGSGVVGQALVRLLVGESHQVRALSRSDASSNMLRSLGAQPISGDVLDPGSLLPLVDGCDWVFNVAGVNEMCPRDPLHMERVNVEGVRNILEASRQSGVRRLIHTSSAVTIGEARGSVGTEASAHRGHFLSEYERTKYMGERALFEEADGLDVVSVNPSSVQGPGRSTGTGKLILDVVNGKLKFLVDTTVSLIDIDDCARGHLLAARIGRSGSRYLLSGSTLGITEAVRLASRASGRDLSVRLIPGALVTAAVTVAEPVARLFGMTPRFCKEMVRVLRFGHRYDGTRAEAELGLCYRPIEDTIARTLAWFESEGLLDPHR